MNRNIFAILLPLALCACDNSDDTKDLTLPQIEDAGANTAPANCQTFARGENINFKYLFTDNCELGNFNIEIHNNFDHHTHSTSAEECDMEPPKQPRNPWVYNQGFDIPRESQSYSPEISIGIPDDIDTGDYHFMIRLTDRAGWQQIKSVAIKIE